MREALTLLGALVPSFSARAAYVRAHLWHLEPAQQSPVELDPWRHAPPPPPPPLSIVRRILADLG
jgi:hypothetical protein